MNSFTTRPASVGAGVVVLGAVALLSLGAPQPRLPGGSCPPGYRPYRGGFCVTDKHPEPPIELQVRQREFLAKRSSPYGSVHPSAFAAALAERDKMEKSGAKVAGTAGTWAPYGKGPLISNGEDFPRVNGLGLVNLMGRIDSLTYDAGNGRLFAAKGTGGVWLSQDLGTTWRSVGDKLPSQIVGAVAWSSADGGTLLALSGDPTFGGGGYTGFGAFYSRDLGQTWKKSSGIPDGNLGFALEVHPTDPFVVYAGTLFGLYRSTDAGKTYVNVNLPTGECAGVPGGSTGRPECQLANVVTDVVVRFPGGVDEDVPPGTVIAAVGWRGGRRANPDGTVQSPNNGIYRSWSGAPGTFAKLPAPGFAPQERIGRVELGTTTGPGQDHDYLYAIVQDAVAVNGGVELLDTPEEFRDPRGTAGTNLHGVYVSADFGANWTLMADDNAIAKNPATGSALAGTGQALGFEPGVQAWYNEWILPDPTRQTPDGIPTRLAFGLEEVWQNELPLPMSGPTPFKVIGRYFSGGSCLLLNLNAPECPANRPPTTSTTTHPDQHAGLWIPDGAGGVTLVVGNDGGFYSQHVVAGQELDNGGWGDGSQTGFDTLLPYDVAMAKDGTAWAGLQDNGHIKINPDGSQYMTFGGDGTFAEVDPANSNIAYEGIPFGEMNVTTDGGTSWRDITPALTNTRFINPFEMDPTDASHLVTAGNEVVETVAGSTTGDGDSANAWHQVFDLGTAQHPGDPNAAPAAADPANGMSAIAVRGDAIYVGFCGACDVLNNPAPFRRGLATNVGGSLPPRRLTSDGWHIAAAHGLPNRFITSIAIDPADARTIYVALGGYSRRWVPPGTLQDENPDVGEGHLFKSTDAGESFADVSGNLPDVPATWVTLREKQLIVGTDVGVFASALTGGTTYAVLRGLPVVPISTLQLAPHNPNLLVAATYGRGVWTFTFAKRLPVPGEEPPPEPLGIPLAGPFGFEPGDEGWAVETTGLPTTTWRRGTTGNASTFSFQVTPYFDQGNTSLVSPPIDHPGGFVFLSWWNRRDTEPGFDFMSVEWSSDAMRWNAVASFDGRNAGYPAFSQQQAAFDAPAGPLFVRFRLVSDLLLSAPLYEGVFVDDVYMER